MQSFFGQSVFKVASLEQYRTLVQFLQCGRIACNAERCYTYSNSVRPSIRLSHAGIVPDSLR